MTMYNINTNPIISTVSNNQTQTSKIAFTPIVTTEETKLNEITPSHPQLPKDWQLGWLQGIPCHLPCWQGLKAGITTKDEAIKLLQQNPLINSESIEWMDSLTQYKVGEIKWNWKNNSGGGKASYDMKVDSKTIITITGYYSNNYKLKDITLVYGEPTYIRAIMDEPVKGQTRYYSIIFFWVKQGLAIGLDAQTVPYSLKPELILGSKDGFALLLVAPNNIQIFISAIGFSHYQTIDYQTIVAWQGYKPFSFYCHDNRTGTSCPENPNN